MDDRVKIHRQYYSNYFRLCIESGNFSEGLAVLEEHLREAEQLDQRSFARGTYFFQYFYIYFGAERYDEALHYLNQWLDLPRSVEQQDLQSLARLLNLILHHEMDNQLLLSSLLRSTERHLRKRRRMMAFEALLLGCLRQVNRATSQREKQAIFRDTLERLEAMELAPEERALPRFFDFTAWLEAHVGQASFAERVRAHFLALHPDQDEA